MYTTIYENKIKVLIYGPNIQLEDADMDFHVDFTDESEPNSCKLNIYNLNDTNLDAVLNNTEYIEIFTNQYGVKDSEGSIVWQNAFQGIPRSIIKKSTAKKPKKTTQPKYLTPALTVNHDSDASDYSLNIELQEGDGADIGTFVNKSYRTGFNVKKILTDLAHTMDMEIVFDSNIQNFSIPYPIILHDNIRNSLIQVASYIDANCNIANNKVYISSNNPKGIVTYFQFDEENIKPPKFLQGKKIEFTAPYMPSIVVGTFIKLVNERMNLNDVYQVCKVESTFSNHDEHCESKITVKY